MFPLTFVAIVSNYKLHFVQNITDVDDKIILRGRQQYLFANFRSEHPTLDDKVRETAIAAFTQYITKNLPLLAADLKPEDFNDAVASAYATVLQGKSLDGTGPPSDKEAKIKMHLKTAGSAATALLAPSQSSKDDIENFWSATADAILPYLDSLHGSSIDGSKHDIWLTLTKKYEDRFNEDMASLNVLPPDVVTRVSDFVPEIDTYTEKIVSNGFAYKTADGVYFDIEAFERAPGNSYARLEPWNRNDSSLVADGEGALSTNATKKNGGDFALWKSSKPGEPAWESKAFGKGRPGWHIECSVMASSVIGSQMDIHSGGIDLCFPHHDNELAQSEAYFADKSNGEGVQWVNYFLHMGHLSISGSKMSKSLKNFTTIRDAVSRGDWTARSFRIIILMNGWHDGIEITDDMRKAGAGLESYISNFFIRVNDLKLHPKTASTGTEDAKIQEKLERTKTEVHAALSDSFDTPAALRAIKRLIEDWNTADHSALSDEVSEAAARYVTQIVRIFGLDGNADPNDGGIGWSGIDIPEVSKPFVFAASRLRDNVRSRAINKEDLSESAVSSILEESPSKQQDAAAVPFAEILSQFQEDVLSLSKQNAKPSDFLELSDRLRDVHLWNAGIYLEDRTNAPAMVRPVDADLRAEREQKEVIARQKAEAKEKREREEAEKKAKLAAQAKINPKEMFRTTEYSAWDEDGMPTKDKEGADVPKSKAKKLRKEWEKQKKLHEEHLKGVGSS